MNEQPEMLSFVKAMASAERLRIIGVLVRGRATQAEIAEQLHLPVRDVFNHLAFLVHVGVVNETEGVPSYALPAEEPLGVVFERVEATQEALGRIAQLGPRVDVRTLVDASEPLRHDSALLCSALEDVF